MAGDTSPPEKNRKEGGKRPNRRKSPNDDDNKFDWQKAIRTLAFWILIFIVGWILFHQMNFKEGREVQKSYTQYRQILESGQVSRADITDKQLKCILNDGSIILTTLPFIDQQMLAEWDSLKIDYQFKEKTTNWLGMLVTSILPWVIIIGFWVYIMRRMQGGGGGQRGLFSFGKSRAKMMVESNLRITFEDVAGCDEAKEELREVIEFLRDPKKFSRLGGRIPKGALLLGPPGTGKTLLARAIAGEAQVPFYSMSGADFVEMFVGVGAARVRDLFEQGKKSAPCIIFIDEIDAVGRQRGAGLGGGHDEREQTLNQLLVEMDGFESNEGVILIAATNRPDVLDPALTRPGRFDRQIVVDRPDVRGREGILKVHARKVPLAPDVRLDVLAKGTPGLSGADLANLVNEAALLAARNNANQVNMLDFENAKDKVMMGAERKSMLISEDERKQTAYHEAGHVLVAKMTPGADPVHKVTIIPRGRALGVTHYLPMDEKHNYSRAYLKQNLVHLMGGRAAEKIIFNELSTGGGNDIERATQISRKMVCEWGMSEKMGPVAYERQNEEVFLGRDFAKQRDYSEKTAQEIDFEIHRIIVNSEQKAEKLLRDNIRKLHQLASVLLEREILDGDEIDQILAGKRLKPMPNRLHGESDLTLPDFSEKLPDRSTERPSDRTGERDRYTDRDKQHERERSSDRDRTTERERSAARTTERPPAPVNRPRLPVVSPPKTETAEKTEKAETKTTDSSRGRPRSSARRPRASTTRPYGIASSRDLENLRPSSRELAKMDRREAEPESPKTAEKDSEKEAVKPIRSRRAAGQVGGTVRRTASRTTVRRRPTRTAKSTEGSEGTKSETPISGENTSGETATPKRASESKPTPDSNK